MWDDFRRKFGLDAPHAESVFLVGYGATFLTVELKTSKPTPPAWMDTVATALMGTAAPRDAKAGAAARMCALRLNELRIAALKPERTEAGLFAMLQYCWQLDHLEDMRKASGATAHGQFTWTECFLARKEVAYKTILEEKACMLFNVGARCSQLGAMQDVWSKEGLRVAATYFQQAAGIFLHIRDRLVVRFDRSPPRNSDLSEATLTALYNVMLAQAHECFFERANLETPTNSATTAQIAMQSAEYYDVAHRNSREKAGLLEQPRFSRAWVDHMHAKHMLFAAAAQFHVPPSIENKELGERILRLRRAHTLLAQALEISRSTTPTLRQVIQKHSNTIDGQLALAIKLNDEVHHELIPKEPELAVIRRPSPPLVHPVDIFAAEGWLARGFANASENIFDTLLSASDSERWMRHTMALTATLTHLFHQLEALQARLDRTHDWLAASSDVLSTNTSSQPMPRHQMLECLLAGRQQIAKLWSDQHELNTLLASQVPATSKLVATTNHQMELARQLQQNISSVVLVQQPILDWCEQQQQQRNNHLPSVPQQTASPKRRPPPPGNGPTAAATASPVATKENNTPASSPARKAKETHGSPRMLVARSTSVSTDPYDAAIATFSQYSAERRTQLLRESERLLQQYGSGR